ncbi:unnamed protein product, partial [Hapterophycus canaliculatus]
GARGKADGCTGGRSRRLSVDCRCRGIRRSHRDRQHDFVGAESGSHERCVLGAGERPDAQVVRWHAGCARLPGGATTGKLLRHFRRRCWPRFMSCLKAET